MEQNFLAKKIFSVDLNITLCSNLPALIRMHGMSLPHGVDSRWRNAELFDKFLPTLQD